MLLIPLPGEIVGKLCVFTAQASGLRRFYFKEDSRMQLEITYDTAKIEDIEPIYQLCRQLILDYENLESIDCDRVLNWVHKK